MHSAWHIVGTQYIKYLMNEYRVVMEDHAFKVT